MTESSQLTPVFDILTSTTRLACGNHWNHINGIHKVEPFEISKLIIQSSEMWLLKGYEVHSSETLPQQDFAVWLII
jgi:hypothetical protein